MKPIVAPIRPDDQGAEIANLQTGLIALIRSQVLRGDSPEQIDGLLRGLDEEQRRQIYGGATKEAVYMFQRPRHLQGGGAVVEETAAALNAALREIGALAAEVLPRAGVISGKVQREGDDALPLPGLRIRASHETGNASIRLGEDITDAEGRYTIRYEPLPGVEAIRLRVEAIGADDRTITSVNLDRSADPLEIIDLRVPMAMPPRQQRKIVGIILLEQGIPAQELKLRLYQRDFGGSRTLLGETSTEGGGTYVLSYTAQESPNIEMYAVDSNGQEVQLSRTKFGAGSEERLDLIAPANVKPMASEFSRLRAAVSPQLGGRFEALKDAIERGPRRDFTLLASTTGWDAVALALASEAVDGEARTGIPAESFYALARAGLPTDIKALAHISKQTIADALNLAADTGIIDRAAAVEGLDAFKVFATEHKFSTAISGAPSSAKDFVAKARISDADRATFAKVVRDDEPGIFGSARRARESHRTRSISCSCRASSPI